MKRTRISGFHKRTIKKQFWMNEYEDRQLKRKAKMTLLTEAALIRTLIAGYEPRQAPGKEFYECMNQMTRIGTNINQIAAKANSTGQIDAGWLEQEMSKLTKLQAKIEMEFLLPVDRRDRWQ